MLDEATETAGQRARQLTGSTTPAIDELGRRWLMLHADLLAKKMAMVEQVQALRVQSGELIVYTEAEEVMVGFLRELRAYCEVMPAAMALRCNPSDPVLAQTALTEWVQTYFAKLRQAPVCESKTPASRGQRVITERE